MSQEALFAVGNSNRQGVTLLAAGTRAASPTSVTVTAATSHNGDGGSAEVQTISFSATPDRGSWTLAGQTLQYDATTVEVDAALSTAAISATSAGSMAAGFTLTWGGNGNQAQLAATSALTLTSTTELTSDPVTNLGEFHAIVLQLDLTSAATAAGDKLNVYLQFLVDGVNWTDCHHFAEMAGTGGAKRFFAKVLHDAALTEFSAATALSASAGRSVFGDSWRIRSVITSLSAASFTYSVRANVLS
jgi:hypothetical protein